MAAEQIKGMAKLLAGLGELEQKVENKVIRTVLRAAAKEIANTEKDALPIGTGDGNHGSQKRLIKVRALKRKKGRIGFAASIADAGGKWYTSFTDLGTKHQKKQDYLKKVAETKGVSELEKAVQTIGNQIEGLLKQL